MEKLQCEKFIYSATKLKLSKMDKLTHLHYIQITSQLRGKFRDTQEQAMESGLAICNMKRC